MGNLFVFLQYLVPQHRLSRLAGWLASRRSAFVRLPFIFLFARIFRVDLSEARIQDYRQFKHFNDFFTRQLRDGCRPLAGDDNTVVSPVDGTVSQVGSICAGRLLQAKGIDYSVTALLGGDEQDARTYQAGHFVTLYLSPRDYHRVHMPIAGKLLKTVYVPGELFSVNRRTTSLVPGLFTRNERLVCFFTTPAGPMAMVLVGAMIVAGIETVWAGLACPGDRSPQRRDYNKLTSQVKLKRGAEMGRFRLGSTVILLFGPEAISFSDTLQAEAPVRLGEAIATLDAPGY